MEAAFAQWRVSTVLLAWDVLMVGKKFTTNGGLGGRMLICLGTQVTCIDILALNQMIPHFEEQFPDVNTQGHAKLC